MNIQRSCQVCGRKEWPVGTLDQYVDVCCRCLKISTRVASLLTRAEGFDGAGRRLGLLPEKQELTRVERDTYNVICSFIYAECRSPTFDELRIEMDWGSKNTVSRHVHGLIAKGYLWPREHKKTFSIRPVDEVWPQEPEDADLDLTAVGREKVAELKVVQ